MSSDGTMWKELTGIIKEPFTAMQPIVRAKKNNKQRYYNISIIKLHPAALWVILVINFIKICNECCLRFKRYLSSFRWKYVQVLVDFKSSENHINQARTALTVCVCAFWMFLQQTTLGWFYSHMSKKSFQFLLSCWERRRRVDD